MEAASIRPTTSPGISLLQSRRVSSSTRCQLQMINTNTYLKFRLHSTSIQSRIGSFFHSSSNTNLVIKAQAFEGGDVDNFAPPNIQVTSSSSGSVLPYVGFACIGSILFGYHIGVVNGALVYLAKDLGIANNTELQGWVVSSLLAAAALGSFTGGSFADKFGRTKTLILDAIPLTLGAFLCGIARSTETMIIGRLLVGIGIGVSSAIVPLYISEISPAEKRGILGSINQLCICIGLLAALVAGLPLPRNPLW